MYSFKRNDCRGKEISIFPALKSVVAILISVVVVAIHPMPAYSQTASDAPGNSKATSGKASGSTPKETQRIIGGGNNVSLPDYTKCIENCKSAGTPEQVNTCMEGCRSIDSKLQAAPASGAAAKK